MFFLYKNHQNAKKLKYKWQEYIEAMLKRLAIEKSAELVLMKFTRHKLSKGTTLSMMTSRAFFWYFV